MVVVAAFSLPSNAARGEIDDEHDTQPVLASASAEDSTL